MGAQNLDILHGSRMGTVVWRTPPLGSLRQEWFIYIDECGEFVNFVQVENPNILVEERMGPHDYDVIEHDQTERVPFGEDGQYLAPLYLVITKLRNQWQWNVLWDTIGFPLVSVKVER